MAKKKKSQRKRNLAYSNRQAAKAQLHVDKSEQSDKPEAIAKVPQPSAKASVASAGIGGQKLAFIRHDLRTIALLAAGCIALELVLWFLLQHTGLGNAVFGI